VQDNGPIPQLAADDYTPGPASRESGFGELILMLRRRLPLIISTVATLLLLATAYLTLVPAKYTASAVILVDPRQQRVLGSEAVLQGIGQDAVAVESQVEVINSNGLARRIVDQLKLDADPEYVSGRFVEDIVEKLGLKRFISKNGDAEPLENNKVVNRFQRALDVRRRGLTYILEVNFTSTKAAKSADVANAIADAYIAEQLSNKFDATTSADDFLSSRIEALRIAVKQSEQAAVDFKAANNLIDVGAVGSGLTLNQRQIEEVNSKLITGRARTAEATARLAQLTQAGGDPRSIASLTEAMASRVLTSLRLQYATVSSREADLATQLQSQHPTLVSVRSQRLEIERRMREELDRVVKNTRSEFDIASSYQASLEASLADLERRNAKLASLRVRFDELEREASANRTQYAQFVGRQKETAEQKAVQKPDARIVSRATAPIRPSSPGPLLVLALASLAGLGLGIGLALLKEGNDTSYRTMSSLEHDTGIACFGVCPLVRGAARQSRTHEYSEGFRQGFANILMGIANTREDVVGRIMLVTSAHDGEGKSTITSGLATLLAEVGTRTLLVTANPPHSAHVIDHAVTSRPNQQPDRALLRELEESVAGGQRLFSISPFSSTALADQAMFVRRLHDFVSNHADSFDAVLIDAPTAGSNRGRNILFEAADSILLVVEWGQTTQAQLQAALHSLGQDRSKVIGIALNKVDERRHSAYEPSYRPARPAPPKVARHVTPAAVARPALIRSATITSDRKVAAVPRAEVASPSRAAAPIALRRPAQTSANMLLRLPALNGKPSLTFADHLSAVEHSLGSQLAHYRSGIDRLLIQLAPAAAQRGPSVSLLCGTQVGVGASSTALSLAYRAASTGRRTLLIDCSSDAALSQSLATDFAQNRPCVLDSREHLAEITLRDERTGLSLLPLALADVTAFSPQQQSRLVSGLRKVMPAYDLVLIDCGAAGNLTTDFLTKLASQVFIITRQGELGYATQIAADLGKRSIAATVVDIECPVKNRAA
jgi:polysaccharide biosynthesis transport protein